MAGHAFKNLSLIAATASLFTQIGAQLFAIVVIVRTQVAAPPRSFAMFQGEYGYDSSIFWEKVPMISLALLLVAVVANWRSTRRGLVLLSLGLFLVASAVAGILVEPGFDRLMAGGYRDAVDAALQAQAATLYLYDWLLWLVSLCSGVALLFALARPVAAR